MDKERELNKEEKDQLLAEILNSQLDKDKSKGKEPPAREIKGSLVPEKREPQKESKVPEEEPEPSREVKQPKRAPRKKKKFKLWMLILGLVIVTIAVFCATVILHIGKELYGIDKSEEAVTITIPSGSNTAEIGEILKEQGIIQYPQLFRLISKMQGADALYREGSHDVKANMPYETIIAELQKESVRDTVDVTFKEGLTMAECAKLLEESGVCGADAFIEAYNKDSGYNFEKLVTENELRTFRLEGCVFPDTYRFYKEAEPAQVVEKIKSNFAEKVNPNMIGRMNDVGMAFQDVITLASIVQLESGISNEMKNVAGVFLNRLNNSEEFPRLESDPTKKYLGRTEGVGGVTVTQEMVDAYDTYVGKGLPPGPVCNPGIAAIEAVLYPVESDYYFFCSNLDTREFFYAKTIKEHEANLRKAGLM